jgi:hypothetical protein
MVGHDHVIEYKEFARSARLIDWVAGDCFDLIHAEDRKSVSRNRSEVQGRGVTRNLKVHPGIISQEGGVRKLSGRAATGKRQSRKREKASSTVRSTGLFFEDLFV